MRYHPRLRVMSALRTDVHLVAVRILVESAGSRQRTGQEGRPPAQTAGGLGLFLGPPSVRLGQLAGRFQLPLAALRLSEDEQFWASREAILRELGQARPDPLVLATAACIFSAMAAISESPVARCSICTTPFSKSILRRNCLSSE